VFAFQTLGPIPPDDVAYMLREKNALTVDNGTKICHPKKERLGRNAKDYIMQQSNERRQKEPIIEDERNFMPTLYTQIPLLWKTLCISLHHNQGNVFKLLICINLRLLLMLVLKNRK
jgi:hypothetical protein